MALVRLVRSLTYFMLGRVGPYSGLAVGKGDPLRGNRDDFVGRSAAA